MTSFNPFAAFMTAAQNPQDIALVEAFGHFLVTLAAHNKQHLGAGTTSALTGAGNAVQTGGVLAAELGAVLAAPQPAAQALANTPAAAPLKPIG